MLKAAIRDDLPNVTLSPHLGYVTRELLSAIYSDTVEAVLAWRDGEPIRIANGEALAERSAATHGGNAGDA